MTAIYSTLKTALRNTALVALNEYPTVTAIFSHQNGLEPAGSYVTISILSVEQQGHHSTSSLTNTVEELTVSVAYEVMVQFSFVGSASGDMAYSFNQRINNNPLVFQELAKNKLGVLRKSTVRRAPQKRDTQWVEYHNMDVTFSYFISNQQIIDVVEGVVLQENLSETPLTIKIPESIIYP